MDQPGSVVSLPGVRTHDPGQPQRQTPATQASVTDDLRECVQRLKAEGWRVVRTKDWGHWPLFDKWGIVDDRNRYVDLVEILEEA